ncbi:DNA polymerase III subunit delta' [Thermocrinis minervae]|uniref:DNA polymerase-3 subunit delta n=1 Tax=Thermocrinis minervae TaxID=381751 RepID=A0A1M6SNX0_9AQUI|nr:DNA polymerase III subunit delta' [Thermocrinis minervae]SHK46356.1 DNA polymerase-3 subunit delta' [Thermocrinis minervae]
MRERIEKFLGSMYRHNKVPNAIVFYGKEGVGKKTIAFELAKALLCLKNTFPACESCASCLHMNNFKHMMETSPEDLEVFVEGQSGKEVFAYFQGDHPDFVYVLPEKTEIKIDQIRAVKEFAYLRPGLSKRKVVLIGKAHTMNPYSQNALLKVLEEPPLDTYFLLTCDSLDKLLPTVKSRSFLIEVPPFTDEEISQITGVKDPQLLRLADGSVSMLKEIMQKKNLLQMAQDFLKKDPLEVYKVASQAEDLSVQDQEFLLKILEAMAEDANAQDAIALARENLGRGIRLDLFLTYLSFTF